jgi:hypothetical protein
MLRESLIAGDHRFSDASERGAAFLVTRRIRAIPSSAAPGPASALQECEDGNRAWACASPIAAAAARAVSSIVAHELHRSGRAARRAPARQVARGRVGPTVCDQRDCKVVLNITADYSARLIWMHSSCRLLFRAHRDNTTKGTEHRRFTVSINLNAEFEGGGLNA